MTLGIDYLNDCLTFLGNPQNRLNCIHIGGTNGKGSTTNYVESILQESGYKVGPLLLRILYHTMIVSN